MWCVIRSSDWYNLGDVRVVLRLMKSEIERTRWAADRNGTWTNQADIDPSTQFEILRCVSVLEATRHGKHLTYSLLNELMSKLVASLDSRGTTMNQVASLEDLDSSLARLSTRRPTRNATWRVSRARGIKVARLSQDAAAAAAEVLCKLR
jgi:hypothetical protein